MKPGVSDTRLLVARRDFCSVLLAPFSSSFDGAGLIGAMSDWVRHDGCWVEGAIPEPEVEAAGFPASVFGGCRWFRDGFTGAGHELVLQADGATDERRTEPEAHAAVKAAFVVTPVVSADRDDVCGASVAVPVLVCCGEEGAA